MIRRTFLKALCVSPLVGLIPKAERRRVYMKPACGGDLKDPLSPYAAEMARSMSESIDKVILKAIL